MNPFLAIYHKKFVRFSFFTEYCRFWICPFNYFGLGKPWYLTWFHLVWKAFYCSGLCVPMWGKLPPRDRPCCRPWPRSRTTAFHGHPQIWNRKIDFFTYSRTRFKGSSINDVTESKTIFDSPHRPPYQDNGFSNFAIKSLISSPLRLRRHLWTTP